MNITMRKLAMLEKEFERREECAKIDGFCSAPIDNNLKENITKLMDKIRVI